MKENTIRVSSENIFPIIKKFLYSERDIFLRELISNATDAIIKFKILCNVSNIENINNEWKIQVLIDKNNKTLHIIDNGIGMNEKEVEKYINQIAFSGAEEFIQKYKNSDIIGHYGLGFYSSFMVSDKVKILTQSYQEKYPSVCWVCQGSTKFFMKETEKKNRGTEVILFIDKNNEQLLEYENIVQLLKKYCKFMPVKIFLSSKDENKDNVLINNTYPAWKRKPIELKDKDYLHFYKELYPNQLDDPLFWIHLNIDHPFHLTGILFFPRIEKKMNLQKEKIHFYQNQVYVTDNLDEIVPDFLSLLKGVIESSDITLNVSRSHLQNDNLVKNISKYITRKVSDQLHLMYQNDITCFQKKWDNIKIIVEYGMISTPNFFDQAINFYLFITVDHIFYSFIDYKKKIEKSQKDKNGKVVFLYSSNKDEQYSYIKNAKNKKYDVLLMDSPLLVHIIQKLELYDKNISFVRIDSGSINELIFIDEMNEKLVTELSDDNKKKLENMIKNNLINNFHFSIKLERLSKDEAPFMIIIPEWIRRMEEMKNVLGKEEEQKDHYYQMIVNTNHILIQNILKEMNEKKQIKILKEALNLTLLYKNMLRGKNLDIFISEKLKDLIQ
ncbi:molecular chaperone HtpG [Blattabacterium cuenoti]|uniref:molecular chaperone HtpG n=1 Tax=Blattabacterium cuenoti TaxID=1653831 RepID=UPI00163C1726|nr:molecular chaperone HtpG [Blattabacterium cuenoti]